MKYIKHFQNGKFMSYTMDEKDGHFGDSPGNADYDQMIIDVAADPTCSKVQDDTPVPTVDELRIAGYGPIGDQLDMQYKDALNGTTTWVDHIAAVKAANSKG